jgi:hypothetical protein
MMLKTSKSVPKTKNPPAVISGWWVGVRFDWSQDFTKLACSAHAGG